MVNFDASLWAAITPITEGADCDIPTILAAVIPFDLDVFETACGTVGQDCYFDRTLYVPYAFGFLFKEGAGTVPCYENSASHFIYAKPDGNNLPFEGIEWSMNTADAYVNSGVTITSFRFYYQDSQGCYDHEFLNGCFTYLHADASNGNDYSLSFSLLTSVSGLEEGTEHDLYFLWTRS